MPELMTKAHLRLALETTELRITARFAVMLTLTFGLLFLALRTFPS